MVLTNLMNARLLEEAGNTTDGKGRAGLALLTIIPKTYSLFNTNARDRPAGSLPS